MSAPLETASSATPVRMPAGAAAWSDVAVRVAAVASVVAGLIHYGVIPQHRAEWWAYAAFFTLLGGFQLVWAVAVWTGPDRRVLLLGAAVNVVALAIWAVSRTGGLPFGPYAGESEPVAAADVICGLAEAVSVAAVAVRLRLAHRSG